MLVPEQIMKKGKNSSEQSFVNAVINIRIPEMNSAINSKTWLECLRKLAEGTENILRPFDIVKIWDSEIWDAERVYKGS